MLIDAWPSSSWTVRRSAPPSNRWVAHECRRTWGLSEATSRPAAAESADCTTARTNLSLLNGKGAVLQDTNGDGKPDTPLDDGQREAQKTLAEAGIKAYCKPAA